MGNIGNAVGGAILEQVVQVTANYTVQQSDNFVQVTTGSGNVTVTLPTPSVAATFNAATTRPDQSTVGQLGNVGQAVTIQKIDSGAGHVIVSGTMNIGKAFGVQSQWSQAKFVSDGTNWNLVATVS